MIGSTTGRLLLLPALCAVAVVANGCGGVPPSTAGSPDAGKASRPTQTYPAPAGLLAGAQPQPDGYMWLVARSAGTATLQELNLTSGAVATILPESPSATSIAEASSGVIAVGLATAGTGALELRNGASGLLTGTVPIGAPVRDVFASSDGSTFYVLDGTVTSTSVTVVDATTVHASVTIPVPLGTVSIAVDPSSHDLFALGANGSVSQITIGTGAVAADFPVGAGAVQLAMSPTGSVLYVLKSTGATANVGLVDVQTEQQKEALAAPANSVDVQVSPDGQHLYAMVGTPGYGNVQVFPSGA